MMRALGLIVILLLAWPMVAFGQWQDEEDAPLNESIAEPVEEIAAPTMTVAPTVQPTRTPEAERPRAPTDLVVVVQGGDVTLRWTDNAGLGTPYLLTVTTNSIGRSALANRNPANGRLVHPLRVNEATNWVVYHLGWLGEGEYCFTIMASNPRGQSDPATVCARIMQRGP